MNTPLTIAVWALVGGALGVCGTLVLSLQRADLRIGHSIALTAGAFGVLAGCVLGWRASHNDDQILLFWFAASAVAAVSAAIDLRRRIIPNQALGVGLVAWAVSMLLWGVGFESVVRAVLSAVVVGALLLVVSYFSAGGFGMGDVKLLALLAMFGGVVSPHVVVATLIISSATGGAAGVLLVIMQHIRTREPIPFGPFILCGWLLTILLTSDQLLNAGFVS